VKTPGPLSLSITALGSVPKGKMVPRPGVESSDQLYVSGTIGDAALGLRLRLNRVEDGDWIGRLSHPAHKFLQDRYLLPQPRLALRAPLRGFARTAMDISDGLIGDLAKMLRLTGMTTTLIAADIPISFAVREALSLKPQLIESVLTGGDDYELLCAVGPEKIASFEASLETSGLSMRCIGRAKKGKGSVSVLDAAGKPLLFTQNSFQHF
jgi:thiamine-monophosphate kinase